MGSPRPPQPSLHLITISAHSKGNMNPATPTGEVDYSVINLSSKWKILRQQWRFALWSLWVSIGSFMLGL